MKITAMRNPPIFTASSEPKTKEVFAVLVVFDDGSMSSTIWYTEDVAKSSANLAAATRNNVKAAYVYQLSVPLP